VPRALRCPQRPHHGNGRYFIPAVPSQSVLESRAHVHFDSLGGQSLSDGSATFYISHFVTGLAEDTDLVKVKTPAPEVRPAAGRETPAGQPQPPPVVAPPPAAVTPTAPIQTTVAPVGPPTPTPTTPTPTPAPRAPSEEPAIRTLLGAYAEGYSNLDVTAIQRAYLAWTPSRCEEHSLS
jgi:hypothetical protein